jgi:uncharacterized protein
MIKSGLNPRSWGVLLLGLLGFVACKSSQKVSYTPEKIVPTDNSLLWRISGNGLKQASYLYGTIHLIPKDELKLSEVTLSLLERSERIVFEIDMKEMTNVFAQFSVMGKVFMKNGKTLKDVMPAQDYAVVHAALVEKGMGAGMFERMKPMFLSMLLLQGEEGESAQQGKTTSVEMELYRVARKSRIKSGGLETTDYQLGIFDKIPYEAQANMLLKALKDAESGTEGPDSFAEMVRLYKTEDITGMQKMVSSQEQGLSEYEDLLLGNRNRNWIPIMGEMMKAQPTFFAVGAGHLGGGEGVVALLRKAGYRVEAVAH